MDITLLIQTVLGLVVVLGILVFILVMPPKKQTQKKKRTTTKSKPQRKTDLETLRHIIRNRLSTKEQLKQALDDVLKYHGNIPKKLGTRVNPRFDEYMEILIMICRHPHTDKDIIINFDRELTKRNPEYQQEISEAIKRGLDSRSITS